jgi:hypothetical protein
VSLLPRRPVEVVVDQADGHGALADGRGHPFDRTAAHVAGGEPSRPVVDRTKDVPTVDIHVGSATAWSRRPAGQRCGSVRGDLDRRHRFQPAQGVLLLTLTGTKPPQPPGAGAEGGG